MILKNLRGQKFGRLLVLDPVGRDKQGYVLWKCKCDCGNWKIASSKYIGQGTYSCGCLNKERRLAKVTRHGMSRSRLYTVYCSMWQRCTNPNAHEYENYGGRGIKVCDEWKDFNAFAEWALANGYNDAIESRKYAPTLDRIDVNGDYEPSNCRFVTMKIQQRNRRSNRLITHNGETHCMSEWAEIAGVPYGTFIKRIYAGWPMESALNR